MNTLYQHQNNFMVILGAVIIVIVIGWFVFRAIDSLSLESFKATAIVEGKEFRPAGTTLMPQNASGTTHYTHQVTSENYLLKLLINNKTIYASVPKEKYEYSNSLNLNKEKFHLIYGPNLNTKIITNNL